SISIARNCKFRFHLRDVDPRFIGIFGVDYLANGSCCFHLPIVVALYRFMPRITATTELLHSFSYFIASRSQSCSDSVIFSSRVIRRRLGSNQVAWNMQIFYPPRMHYEGSSPLKCAHKQSVLK